MNEITLRHLHYHLIDVLPQTSSQRDNVFDANQPVNEALILEHEPGSLLSLNPISKNYKSSGIHCCIAAPVYSTFFMSFHKVRLQPGSTVSFSLLILPVLFAVVLLYSKTGQ